MNRIKKRVLVMALGAGLMLVACNPSPEALRERGGGPGADLGNRDDEVEIHGETIPSYDTPLVGKAIEHTYVGAEE